MLSQTKNGIAALDLVRKFMQTMRKRSQRYRPEGTVQMDDACLGGEEPGGKRGRGSEN